MTHRDVSSIRTVRLIAACAAALSAAACSDGAMTAHFGSFAHTRVQGQVVRSLGAPLDSIAVVLYAPPRDGASYDLPNAKTDKNGTFDFVLERVAVRPGSVLPEPDTLTVAIIGTDLRSTASPLPHDTVRVLVNFTPIDQPAPVTHATLAMTR